MASRCGESGLLEHTELNGMVERSRRPCLSFPPLEPTHRVMRDVYMYAGGSPKRPTNMPSAMTRFP